MSSNDDSTPGSTDSQRKLRVRPNWAFYTLLFFSCFAWFAGAYGLAAFFTAMMVGRTLLEIGYYFWTHRGE